ncbi:MAG: DUF930 domain-containing protein [Pseudolabrys sp.]
MRRLVLAIGASLLMIGAAAAMDARFARSLKKLAPVDRLEQLCDYTAMKRIRHDHHKFRPDRAVAGAETPAHISGHTVVAKGGAFRSRRKWYALSYTCKAQPDHLAVTEFTYKIGTEIPEEKWARYGLWE